MYLRTLLIIVLLAALVLFAAVNWNAFTTPTTLSVIFTTVEAPLGLILLAVIGAFTVLFLIYLVYWQSSALLESRRHSRETQNLKEIAEHAEASRFSELRLLLEQERREMVAQSGESKSAILTRLDEIERELRATIEQSSNTLAAYIGEVDDRMERAKSGKN
ncbi:MAG TPA: LapA family protein [Candidatus Binatia bacterium]|jgi:uncharacterized integral membrane protein